MTHNCKRWARGEPAVPKSGFNSARTKAAMNEAPEAQTANFLPPMRTARARAPAPAITEGAAGIKKDSKPAAATPPKKA
jgi:hypothetical protein